MFSEADILQIYNSRTKKDMPFQEFRKRVKAAIDPKGIQQDVARILTGRERKRQIDAAIANRRDSN